MKRKSIIYLLIVLSSMLLVNNVCAKDQRYKIKKYNTNISVSSNYDVIIKNKDNSSVYDKLGLNKDEIENYMATLNAYFLATTQDLKKNIIITRQQDEDTKEYYNLTEVDEDIVNALAEGYSQGFKTNDYSVEEVNDITYIKLKYDLVSAKNEHLYYLKYKTIYNGYDYTIYIQKYSEITNEDEEELKNIIKNLKIKEIEQQDDLPSGYIMLTVAAAIFGIAMIVWDVHKKKKNKDKTQKK